LWLVEARKEREGFGPKRGSTALRVSSDATQKKLDRS
jgi:hypothetical protein